MVPLHGTCLLEVRAASLGRQDSGGLILSRITLGSGSFAIFAAIRRALAG